MLGAFIEKKRAMKTRFLIPLKRVNFMMILMVFTVGIISCKANKNTSVTGPQGSSGGGTIGCAIFPADNIWNTPVDTSPVDLNSAAYIASIGADIGVHPDFGSGTWDGEPIGIPYIVVSGTQSEVPIHFVEFGDEIRDK
jgi:hypothetical protein